MMDKDGIGKCGGEGRKIDEPLSLRSSTLRTPDQPPWRLVRHSTSCDWKPDGVESNP